MGVLELLAQRGDLACGEEARRQDALGLCPLATAVAYNVDMRDAVVVSALPISGGVQYVAHATTPLSDLALNYTQQCIAHKGTGWYAWLCGLLALEPPTKHFVYAPCADGLALLGVLRPRSYTFSCLLPRERPELLPGMCDPPTRILVAEEARDAPEATALVACNKLKVMWKGQARDYFWLCSRMNSAADS